ncbi:MAG: DEAD/DEAH box helicase family protein, partial [Planctomycetota bacterium]
TAAFLITMFSKFLREPIQGERPIGTPRALVLAPTRELAIQIVKDAEDLGKYCRLNSIAIYGGLEVKKQKNRLDKRPVDLIVATPGRLLDFVRRKVINLKKIEFLVIDEADRMLDMGFIPDVKRIIR